MKVGDLVRPKRFKSVNDYDYPEFDVPSFQTKIPEIEGHSKDYTLTKKANKRRWQPFPCHWQRGIVIEVVERRVRVYWNEQLGTMWHSEQLLEILNESG